jgi:hypothetical protein
VHILGPLDGSQLSFSGPVTFAWEANANAKKYLITFHYPNGLNVQFETSETNITRYIETMQDAGAYSWDVTALDETGQKICQSEPETFEKPSSHPEDLVDPKPPACNPCNPASECFDVYMCGQ